MNPPAQSKLAPPPALPPDGNGLDAPPDRAPAPMWFWAWTLALAAAAACLFFWQAGGVDPLVYAPWRSRAELAVLQPKGEADLALAAGRKTFELACAPCHQTAGTGIPGKVPPLAGSEWVAAAGPGRLVRLVLDGLQGPVRVAGQEWNLAMPGWRETLTDEQIAAALSHARASWGQGAGRVTPAQVQAARQLTRDRAQSYTTAELEKTPE